MSGPRDLIPALDRAFDALERRDLGGFIAAAAQHMDPDCVLRSGIGSVVGGRLYRGVDGIREWFAELLETADDIHWLQRRYEPVGETVLLFLAQLEFTGAASQAPVASEVGAVYEFEDDLCKRVTSFTSHAEARDKAEAVHA